MPEWVRRSLLPLCRRAPGPVWIGVLSLVIGIWTHVLWDSVTHVDGWLVEHIPVLFLPVFHFDGRTARVCTVLWYGSSFVAVGWLFMAFEKWRQNAITTVSGRAGTGKRIVQDAIVLAILVIPVSLVHHLIRSPLGSGLTAGFCLSFGILFIWKMAVATEQHHPDIVLDREKAYEECRTTLKETLGADRRFSGHDSGDHPGPH
jgi:hypothetical protein